MTQAIVCLGLLILPLVPVEWRESAAILFIGALAARVMFRPSKPVVNPWLAALIVYLPISIISSPHIRLLIGSEDLGGLWMWRGLAWAFGYYMVFLAVQGICFCRERVKKMIAWGVLTPALLSSFYFYVQLLNIDQWQYTLPYSHIGSPDVPGLTAMIGNPTYLAVYLGLSLPFAVAYAPWWVSVLIGAPILFLHSETALAGVPLAFLIWQMLRIKKYSRVLVLVSLLVVVTFAVILLGSRVKINPNGRTAIWSYTLEDWRQPPLLVKPDDSPLNKRSFAVTGRGLGSFQYLFPLKHHDPGAPIWTTAHNEYLETLYSIGLVGIILLCGSLRWLMFHARRAVEDRFFGAAYISATFSIFAAFTLPIWHVEPMRFLSVIMFALLSSFCYVSKHGE